MKMLDDKILALLGNRDAQDRITERGELLPCPRCGSAEGIRIIKYDEESWSAYCYCKNDSLPSDVCVYGTSEKETIGKWNTRAPLLTPTQMAVLERETGKIEEGSK